MICIVFSWKADKLGAHYLVSCNKDLLDLMKWEKEISREFQRRFKFRKIATPKFLFLMNTSGKYSAALRIELSNHPGKEIGANADDIRVTDTLPKTRAGKIISRLLRELAAVGKVSGDTTTLEDFSVWEELCEEDE